jgi:regulator of sigma E protease
MPLDILIFLAVLSILIFVHELGHFLAAKACNIYVDRFSIGMPPRLFGLRLGETDYCVSALPIGGYVKMAGQEDAPLSEEEREKEYGHVPEDRWFNKKPVWQRHLVSVSGPLMNLVLGVLLYGIVAAVGDMAPEWESTSRIGVIEEGSPAEAALLYRYDPEKGPSEYEGTPDAAGWKTGDRILSLDGRKVDNITDLAIGAILGGEDTVHHVVLERPEQDGSALQFFSPVSPEAIDEKTGHPRFGVAPFETAVVGNVMEDTPAEAAGLNEGDIILRANGEIVDQPTFIQKVEQVEEGGELALLIERDGEKMEVALRPKTVGRLRGLNLAQPGEGEGPLEVLYITGGLLEKTGLKRKDTITAVNGEKMNLEALRELEQASPGKTLTFTVERPEILFGVIQKPAELTVDVPVASVRAIGVGLVPKMVFRRTPFPQVIPEAFRQSYLALERTLLTIKALVTRDVSPKDIGGPLMIFDVTTKAAKAGWSWLLKITAFISINLCVFNLLPLPVLDGGQVLINSYEGIFRKPLSMKFQERFQFVGLVLIIGLMLFVTWNDISRFVERMVP